ncbi:MAG TPA: AmmeMemoRadiSam system radical SAM enzyme [Syntrophomonas sp.]|nr:AmmeMemoRadiSam system radical SAM enzyme [Syntrophomonas sp.]
MPERIASYFEPAPDQMVQCHLCPHQCSIKIGKTGLCGVRRNGDGVLYTLNYGEITSLALDPVEKKPLYHFHPGSMIVSAGTVGCNMFCSFCQNYSISRHRPPTTAVEPGELAGIAREAAGQGSIGVAFTYNEPSIWYEFIWDTVQKLKENGLNTVLVTNGYLQLKPLQNLLPYIDAMNIDVKAFNEGFYRRRCMADLNHVKETVENAVGRTHVEITNLVIPGENDDLAEIGALAGWLAGLSPLIPLHISRYYPAYQMSTPPTPVATLEQAVLTAREHLQFVYAGNINGVADDTLCPHCGHCLITRQNYETRIVGITANCCSNCGTPTTFIHM